MTEKTRFCYGRQKNDLDTKNCKKLVITIQWLKKHVVLGELLVVALFIILCSNIWNEGVITLCEVQWW